MIIFRPVIKSLITIPLASASGLLGSAVINRISENNEINWSKLSTIFEFWLLVICTIILLIFTIFATRDENSLRAKIENEYFLKLFEKDQIGLIVQQQNNAIQQGNFSEFDNLDRILNNLKKK